MTMERLKRAMAEVDQLEREAEQLGSAFSDMVRQEIRELREILDYLRMRYY
jgi:hypothetical protein